MHNVVLIGCGMMAATWAQYVSERDDTVVSALVDSNLDNANDFNARFGFGARVYSDYRKALDAEAIDLVLNTTPPQFHFEITKDALERGCDIFGEKPMAETLQQCTKLVEIAEKTGRVFSVMQNRRYVPGIRSAAEMIRNGIIGNVGMMCADYFMGRQGMGRHYTTMESPLLIDMAIHTFDEARLLSGTNARTVQAYEFKHPGSDFGGNESAVCLFEMDDGSVFSYRGSWCVPGANTPSQGSWRITGDGGTLIWDGESLPYAELRGPEKETFITVSRRVDGANVYTGRETYYGCLDAMFASLHAGSQPETAAADNINSMRMVWGAVESARSGRKVEL